MRVHYRDHAFEFEPLPGESFDGRLLLDDVRRELLFRLINAEDECGFLDEDGERLPAERLFDLSPWSCVGPTGRVKLLCRFLDIRDGSIRFATSETSETYPDDVWRWLRAGGGAQGA